MMKKEIAVGMEVGEAINDGEVNKNVTEIEDYSEEEQSHQVEEAEEEEESVQSNSTEIQQVDHMKQQFDCNNSGKLNEYVGCKIEHNQEEGWLKLTQPMLLQSFEDEFRVTKEGKAVTTPAALNTVLKEHAKLEQVSNEMKTQYCKGIGKFLHLMKWSRLEIMNVVHELTCFSSCTMEKHIQAMR